MSREILLAEMNVRIFVRLMTPITHQCAAGLSIIRVTKISVVDRKMEAAGKARLAIRRIRTRAFEIDVRDLTFIPAVNAASTVRIALDLDEILADKDLLNSVPAPNEPVHGQRIEELVGKNASGKAGRKIVDPLDVEAWRSASSGGRA